MYWEPEEDEGGRKGGWKKDYVDPATHLSTSDVDRGLVKNVLIQFFQLFQLKKFRFDQNGIDYLCDLVREDLVRDNTSAKGNPIPLDIKVI